MRIEEVKNKGLARAYEVTIPAKDMDARIDGALQRVSKTIRMPGFRPGKVPKNLVKKMHGEALYQDALQEAVKEGVQQVLREKELRPAMQPSVDLRDTKEGEDVSFAMELEILPKIDAPEIGKIELEKLVVEPSDEDMRIALQRLADQQRSHEEAPKTYKAETGDVVVMDFRGTVDGEEFEGGTGEQMPIELGSGRLVPGFEDQLVGVKANEQKTVKVTFPDDYNVAYLKGREAEFDVTVNEVRRAKEASIDDEMAKNFGLDSLDKLKEVMADQLRAELAQLTRTHMKRKLLDQLAADYDFEVPPSMVEAEFDQIWQQLEHEAEHADDPEAAKTEIEADRDDYHRIAERRVRLGLLLSEIGSKEGIEVTQQEMQQLIVQEAQKYRGQEQAVMKYFRENAMAAAQLRAPLFEDKVVDLLLENAETTERKVTRTELEAAIEDEDETPGPTKAKPAEKKKPAAKTSGTGSAAAKKAPAKTTSKKPTSAEGTPAKKAPAKKPAAKKAASAKKTAAKTAPAKKGSAKKAPARKKA